MHACVCVRVTVCVECSNVSTVFFAQGNNTEAVKWGLGETAHPAVTSMGTGEENVLLLFMSQVCVVQVGFGCPHHHPWHGTATTVR